MEVVVEEDFGTVTQHVETNEEKVKEESDQKNADCDHAPLLSRMHTASLANLGPRSISDFIFDVKVRISKVNGAGGTILARLDFRLGRFHLQVFDLRIFCRLE
jgi:hypothetical protein